MSETYWSVECLWMIPGSMKSMVTGITGLSLQIPVSLYLLQWFLQNYCEVYASPPSSIFKSGTHLNSDKLRIGAFVLPPSVFWNSQTSQCRKNPWLTFPWTLFCSPKQKTQKETKTNISQNDVYPQSVSCMLICSVSVGPVLQKYCPV